LRVSKLSSFLRTAPMRSSETSETIFWMVGSMRADGCGGVSCERPPTAAPMPASRAAEARANAGFFVMRRKSEPILARLVRERPAFSRVCAGVGLAVLEGEKEA
jgi:hypothetical protein